VNKIRAWKPDLSYYEDLVGIECKEDRGVYKVMSALCTRELQTCPYEIIVNTIVVPKDALRFMSLKKIDHHKVELRSTTLLSPRVNRELDLRYFLLLPQEKPHYYTTGEGACLTCHRFLVLLSTIKSIEAEFK
jgi:hypothetical protein